MRLAMVEGTAVSTTKHPSMKGYKLLLVQPLDDQGRLELLRSLAGRHALDLPDDVARYLLERTSRHPTDLVETIDRLDHASLAAQRRLTIPFVRDHLALR